jgi:hypothetical protein
MQTIEIKYFTETLLVPSQTQSKSVKPLKTSVPSHEPRFSRDPAASSAELSIVNCPLSIINWLEPAAGLGKLTTAKRFAIDDFHGTPQRLNCFCHRNEDHSVRLHG